ncbi:hypothetical protein [Siccibacter colletis]|uniref:hypothetical protein n=1 Tax=Siccibacter colletis TaxID=1505757 RepID=UPI00191BE643|nr:hypothetical protein [Siccibacter colletis]
MRALRQEKNVVSEIARLRQSSLAETTASALRRKLMICLSETYFLSEYPHVVNENITNIGVNLSIGIEQFVCFSRKMLETSSTDIYFEFMSA